MAVILRASAKGFSGRRLKQAVNRAMRALGLEKTELSLSVVNQRQMIEANRRFFNRSAPTDVIAVPQEAGPWKPSRLRRLSGGFVKTEPEILLGDVIVSWDAARRQAKDYGHSAARELAILAVHGLLHTLGMEDKTEAGRSAMARKVDQLLKARE